MGRLLGPRALTAQETVILGSLREGVLDSRDSERLKAWWLYRILYDPDPLREKLTLFWHGHFATSNRKVQSVALMLRQNELLRRHALGDVATLLKEISADGAMLVWLDGSNSKKGKPNENYAREFLELFTLGVGHYREIDVREAARAFTGWHRERTDDFRGDDAFPFEPAESDDGRQDVPGTDRPLAVGRHHSHHARATRGRRVLVPEALSLLRQRGGRARSGVARPLADGAAPRAVFHRHVVGVILRSRHFYAGTNHRQRIAGPVEFAAGLLRVLEVPRADVSLLALAAACERQGQDLFYPPNVKGWDGGRSWLTSTTILERGNWISDVVWGNADLGMRPFDPLAWAKRNRIAPEQTLETLIELVLQGDIDPPARAAILRTGRDGQPDSLRKGLQLILNCPECQLV